MNTTLKIVTLCVICAAMAMSGCIDSDETLIETVGADNIAEIDGDTSYVPFTMTSIMRDPTGESDYTYSLHYIIKDGGAGEGLIIGLGDDDISIPFTWRQGSASNEFVIIGIDGNEGLLTISDDGTAILETAMEDDDLEGTWERTQDVARNTEKSVTTPTKAKLVSTPRDSFKTTPIPTTNDESDFVMGYPFLVTVEGSGIQEGVNFIVMIDDDGETGYCYTWCGFDIADAYEIKMFDVTHYSDHITYRGNDPNGAALSITAYETERGGGRATQIGFDANPDCNWNPISNVPSTIPDKIEAYNQEWL